MAQNKAPSQSPRAALVHRLASSLGFALVGIAPAKPSDRAHELRAWLDAGKHGDMDYLARYADVAIDPCKIVPDAKAIICVADQYASHLRSSSEFKVQSSTPDVQGSMLDQNGDSQTSNLEPETSNSPTGRIARYAQGDDYHRVIKNRLHQLADALREQFPEHLFRTTVDTAPIMEREHAARAGLGWIGKHTLLIHPQIGSYILLGEIITTLPVQTSEETGYLPPTTAPTDHCGSCTRCIDACPTQCITPYSVDASRCISYLTIEHRGEIDADLAPLMGDWLAGCDVCQEVCPYNAAKVEITNSKSQFTNGKSPISNLKSQITNANAEPIDVSARTESSDAPSHILPQYTPRLKSLPLAEVLNWSEDDRRTALIASPLKRIKLEMFKRNAKIAMANIEAQRI